MGMGRVRARTGVKITVRIKEQIIQDLVRGPLTPRLGLRLGSDYSACLTPRTTDSVKVRVKVGVRVRVWVRIRS
eukprot:1263088-Amorphochlora_amoeboformis.AAC.2